MAYQSKQKTPLTPDQLAAKAKAERNAKRAAQFLKLWKLFWRGIFCILLCWAFLFLVALSIAHAVVGAGNLKPSKR